MPELVHGCLGRVAHAPKAILIAENVNQTPTSGSKMITVMLKHTK